MKKTNVLIPAILLFSMLAAILASCGNSGTLVTTTDDTTASAAETTGRIWLDDLPDTKFGGATFKVFDGTGVWHSDQYTADSMKEVVSKAQYDRLIDLQDRFDVIITACNIPMEKDINGMREWLRAYVQSGTYDFDMTELRCEYLSHLALEGLFIDMKGTGIFDEYIDIRSPWWCDEFTQALNVGNHIFWIYGATNTTTDSSVYVTFFNKELAAICLGEDFSLYDLTREGNWTLERFYEYSRNAYVDDGDGVVGENDRFGTVIYDLDGVALGAGVDYTKRDEDNIPYFNTDFENEIRINEILYDLVKDDCCQVELLNSIGDFPNGNVLFLEGLMRHALRFRDIKWDFGIIPLPKYSEAQENYLGPVLFEFFADAIPVTTPEDRYDLTFTILEAYAAEGYRTIHPAYLDEAMKNKYSRDEDTKEMIDLCCAHITTDFLTAYGHSTGMNIFFRVNIVDNNIRDISSILARKTKPFTKQIESMVESFEKYSQQ